MPNELSASERPLWAALDVQYLGTRGYTGYLVADAWGAEFALEERVYVQDPVAPYRSGFFYQRELPCLMGALALRTYLPQHIVVDGYVQLPGGRKGLGLHLYEALDGAAAVIGVSKSSFKDDDVSTAVHRGASKRALYVTAMGVSTDDAASILRSMHGSHRIPTLLKRVDRLARDASLVGHSAPELSPE